jgi:hypothetical protein
VLLGEQLDRQEHPRKDSAAVSRKPAAGQGSLFSDDDLLPTAQRSERAQAETAASEWAGRFERADWVAPYDTAGGTPKGTAIPGWRCPDPECGKIEPNGFLLSINHGWDPEIPGHAPFDGQCMTVKLAAAHAAYDKRQAQLERTPVNGH